MRGTVRENRNNSTTKTMRSQICKSVGDVVLITEVIELYYVAKWNNNSTVHIASNYNTHLPEHKCKRRVKGVTLDVTQLNMIVQCNKRMGGADQLDQFISFYRPTIRGKKWYWPLFCKTC